MNLTHLRSFLAAADEMHFGKAAKRLNIVQPALSAHIKALEEEFGGQLFFRIGKQVALTNPGRILQHEAQRIFNDIQLMKTAVSQAMSGKTGLLNISYCDIPEMHMLMLPLNEMQTRYPDLYIRLWEENLSSISGGLNDGRLDIAFFTLSSHFQLPPILEIKKICTWALRLALPQNHPLAQTEGPLKIQDLYNENFIVQSITSDTVDRDIFRICGFTPHIVHQTKQIAIICKLVQHGMGLAFLPDLPQIHAADFGIVFRDLEITLPDVVCYAVYKKNRLSPAMKNFIQLIELHDKDHAEKR